MTVTGYAVTDVAPQFAAYDSAGNLWVVNSSFASGHQTLDEIIDGAVADSIIIDDASPNSIAAGANGHIWIADFNGGLDDVDTLGHNVTPHLFTSDLSQTPNRITITSTGKIWFTGMPTGVNTVGRYDPATDSASFLTLAASTNDATALYISANGADGAWVGLPGNDTEVSPGVDVIGVNHLVSAAFSGSISASYYTVHTLNAVPDAVAADTNNALSSVASDGSGGVWFTLANPNAARELPHGADRVVHGVINGANLDQTAYLLPGADANTPLAVAHSTLNNGKLWFNEANGTQAGYFDTAAHTFTFFDYPPGIGGVGDMQVNPAGDQATFIAFDDSSFVQIDLDQTVTFSGAANDLAGQEGHVFNSVLLATFVAPPPGTGSYSATVAWGDSTTTTFAATYMGDNTYAVVVSGKSFASQGTYNGTVTIQDSANVVAGTLTFHSVISDTPLNVTSFAVNPLILRLVTATASFTDDPGRAASSFTATINWGDTTSSTGLIVADPTQAGRYLVIALHQYRRRGTYTARVTVTTSEPNAAITLNTRTASVTV
jgi:hypothetical protein